MPMGLIVAALVFLLAVLGLAAPLVLFVGSAPRARKLAMALILAAVAAGSMAGGAGFFGKTNSVLDFSLAAPFRFSLAVDPLSAFFLLLTCGVAIPVTLFAGSYFERHQSEARRRWTWAFFSWFLLSMIVVITAATGFAFLAGWELMTLVSAGLILIEGDTEERRHNVFIYLVMMHVGAAAVAAAFFFFLPFSHSLDLDALRAAGRALPAGIRVVIFLTAFAGFGTKAGLIPLHLWLPRAHPIAPSPVSALMSGIMLKTAVYGFVRFAFDLLGGGPWWCGYAVLAVAAVTGVLGIFYALAEDDLKRLLAYSSVENIGIIFLGLGAALVFAAHHAAAGATLALVAALLHAWNHAFFKSLLFLGSGAISHSTHSVNLNELGGLQRRMPLTGAAVLVGCCSIAGLPLTNGFVSEWLIFRSFLAGSSLMATKAQVILPLMVGVLGLMGGLAAACFVKAYGTAFLGRPRSAGAEHAEEAPVGMRTGLALLAAGCLLPGIAPGIVLRPLVALAGVLVPGAVVPEETTSIARVIPLVAAIVAGVSLILFLLRGRTARPARTWACGLPGLSSRMQYTSTTFSKPIRFVFNRVYRPDRRIEQLPLDTPYFPVSISYRSVRTTSFEKSLYRPVVDRIVWMAQGLRRMQTGNIQIYLLYIFLALVSLLALLRFEQ